MLTFLFVRVDFKQLLTYFIFRSGLIKYFPLSSIVFKFTNEIKGLVQTLLKLII